MNIARFRKKGSLEETVFLDIVRTADLLSRGPREVIRKEDLTPNQYNVLRILRGSPDGLSCGDIGDRMITADPDITRLLDRLEKRGLIQRWRGENDRRAVMARITDAGLELLDRLDEPVQEEHSRQLGPLGEDKLRTLSDLLTACRAATK